MYIHKYIYINKTQQRKHIHSTNAQMQNKAVKPSGWASKPETGQPAWGQPTQAGSNGKPQG